MRTSFITTLTRLAEKDERVWLLTGDLGYSVFEDFKSRFPDRYLNVGVAEQDLMGIAAGLALIGKRPYVYSISTFASMRAYEQIRNDICYQNLPVVIIGGGSTFSYSSFGCTHMPLEDFALMRVLPRMQVFSPGDPMEVQKILESTHEGTAPAYIRIAKKGEPLLHTDEKDIQVGRMSLMRKGQDATIIVAGRQLANAIVAADLLKQEGIEVRVLSAHTLKPFDSDAVIAAATETNALISVEEHSLIGGLGAAIASVLVSAHLNVPLVTLGVPDEFPAGVGSQEWFLEKYNLTVEGIAAAVRKTQANV